MYDVNDAASKRISDLEKDLTQSQASLKKTVSELETVNEELQATNEELLTSNEELQSSNEELQSVNEELYTANAEYQETLSEVTSLNNDISNFLSSTLVGIIFLDDKLQIRRFTEYVSKEFSVMEQDVGRPIRFIDYNFINIELVEICKRVAAQLLPEETEVISINGKRYFMRVVPYRTNEKKIVGLVVTFVDMNEQSKNESSVSSIRAELEQQQMANREKDSFLSRISYDVRTPLNAILGTAQLMGMQDRTVSDREQLRTIKTNVNYLLGIFNDILETSRISAGHMAIRVLPTTEKAFLESIVPLILADAERFSSSALGYFDAILMDLLMPVMDGREATVVIRSQKRPDAQTVPILMMTADVLAEDRTELLCAGATDFVYKPVDMVHLRDTLIKCLQATKKSMGQE